MLKFLAASLLLSAVNAQYNLTYINLMWRAEPTLTFISSDATATTYEKVCGPETTIPTTPTSSSIEPKDDIGKLQNHNISTDASLNMPYSSLRSNRGIRKRLVGRAIILCNRATSQHPNSRTLSLHPLHPVPRPRNLGFSPHCRGIWRLDKERRVHMDGCIDRCPSNM